MKLRFALLAIVMLLPHVGIAAQAEKLKVAATHSILADVVRMVAGEHIELVTVIPRGADAHSFQPSPRDLTALADADLIFINGAGYEEGLLDSIGNAAESARIIAASACVEIIPFGAGVHDDVHMDEDAHGQEDDHADAEAHTDGAHGHCDELAAEFSALVAEDEEAHHGPALGRLEDIDCAGGHTHDDEAYAAGACDPHVWMDPHNVIMWTLFIRDTLSEMDAENAGAYAANAAVYIPELLALEEDFFLPMLANVPMENRVLITNHDSLGYLANAFDFEVVSTVIPGADTMSEPSSRDIAALIDLINHEAVPAIFGETVGNASVMEAVAAETGAQLVILHSDSLSEDGGAMTYIEYMRYNFAAIVAALTPKD